MIEDLKLLSASLSFFNIAFTPFSFTGITNNFCVSEPVGLNEQEILTPFRVIAAAQ